jgi:hypothetical protein
LARFAAIRAGLLGRFGFSDGGAASSVGCVVIAIILKGCIDCGPRVTSGVGSVRLYWVISK